MSDNGHHNRDGTGAAPWNDAFWTRRRSTLICCPSCAWSQRLRLPDEQTSKDDRADSRRAQVSVSGEHPRLWLVSS